MVFLEVLISKTDITAQTIKLRRLFYLRKIRSQRTILNMKLHLLLSYLETGRKLTHQFDHCHGCFRYSDETNMPVYHLVLNQGISISQPICLMIVKIRIFLPAKSIMAPRKHLSPTELRCSLNLNIAMLVASISCFCGENTKKSDKTLFC